MGGQFYFPGYFLLQISQILFQVLGEGWFQWTQLFCLRQSLRHAAAVKLVPDKFPDWIHFPCSSLSLEQSSVSSHPSLIPPCQKIKELPFSTQSHGRGAGPAARGTIPALLGFSAESLDLAPPEAFGAAAMEHPSWIYAQHKWNLHEI